MPSTPRAFPAAPVLDRAAVDRWRRAWDEVMAGFLPGAAGFEQALPPIAEAVCGGTPGRVLDLGGGPGLLAERLAGRWAGADVGMVDLDPVLLALADAGTGGRLRVHRADLADRWADQVAGPYDLITTVMTVHYLTADQALGLYRAARGVLRPGGLLVVADLMPDSGLAGRIHPAVDDVEAGLAWARWWQELESHGSLRPLLDERRQIFAGRVPAEFTPPVDWHRCAAREAGFAEAGLVWRWGAHAALAAVA